MKRVFLILPLLAFLFTGCQKEPRPRLLVMICVDHLSYDTYTHYLPAFQGGFRWLNDQAVHFEKTYHEHGHTATGPGHFVLGSGLYPGPVGILGNNWYDRRSAEDVYCIGDALARDLDLPAGAVSYANVPGRSLGDWLKAASPVSKVFSVAGKDRAAIMLAGKNPDLALWYNWQGAFTTNSYYTDHFPEWLQGFNRKANMISYRDSVWSRSEAPSLYAAYAHADSFYGESDRYLDEVYSPVFPIAFESSWDDEKVFGELGGRPWLDRLTLDLAEEIIEREDLGRDGTLDILNIGLSAMDIIAHYYGPYSHESMDHLLKLDAWLGDFIQKLETDLGLENILFVMSSDHGGMPLPEHLTRELGKPGGRVDEAQYLATRARAYAVLDSMYGDHHFIHRKGASYYYDAAQMRSRGIDPASVDSLLQYYMESVEGVHRLYSRDELLGAEAGDALAFRLKHFMHPDLSPDLYTLESPGWIFRNPYGTSHGTPYDYDSHVPLLFAGAGLERKIIREPFSSVDLIATLAELLKIKPLNPVDGVSHAAAILNR